METLTLDYELKQIESRSEYILIFKTNIKLKKDLISISKALLLCPEITNWTIDQNDIDNVLRVISKIDNTNQIINLVNQSGFNCEELTY